MGQRDTQEQTIIFPAGTAANGSSTPKEMQSFWHVAIEVAMTGFTGTIKFQVSDAETVPDFSAPASATNPWDYCQVKLLSDNSSVNGATGVTGAATTSVARYEFNSNCGKWFGATISGYAAGSVQVKLKGYGT